MPLKKTDLTFGDALKQLSEGLKKQAVEPNMLGYEPHAKQEIFHKDTRKKKLYIGGNRSGKTVGGIIEDLWWASGRHPYREVPQGGVRGRIVSVDLINGLNKIIIPALKRWIVPSDLRGGSWEKAYDKLERVLHFKNGSYIELMGYDQDLDKFAGTSRHFIHFDEEPPKDIYTECLARLVDTNGSFWITMTPVEGMSWVFDTLYEPGVEEDDPSILVIEISMTENPHINPEAAEAFLSGLDDDERAAREHGRFVQLGGLIYKQFKPAIHVIKPWRPSKNDLIIASLDHGFANPTAWLWHSVDQEGFVTTFYEHYVSGQTVPWHAAAVNRINGELGIEPALYIGDPSIQNTQPISGTSIHYEYLIRGIPIMLGNNDVSAGINRVAQYLKTRNNRPLWTITEECPSLIKEMKRYRWKTYTSKRVAADNNLPETPHKKNDHACDSARYFFMSQPDLRASMPDTSVPQSVNELGARVYQEGPLTALRGELATAPVGTRGDTNDAGWTIDELGGVW